MKMQCGLKKQCKCIDSAMDWQYNRKERQVLSMASTIQVRVDDDLKIKSDSLFRDLGTDTTTAIRMFLTQAVAVNGFPFDIKRHTAEANPYAPMTGEEILTKLKESREKGKYRDAVDVISDISSKYGL